jgi:diguanylate cyclase (GGDEF)-like protein
MTDLRGHALLETKFETCKAVCAGDLIRSTRFVTEEVTCGKVIKQFHDELGLNSLPVLDSNRRVVGVLRVLDILRLGTEIFFNEIFGRRSCTTIMDTAPLVFDRAASLQSMSAAVAGLNDKQLVDGFIVTEADHYTGTGHMTDLIRAVSEQQITVARYANPLTLLPGNVPIDEMILNRLEAKLPFVVGYFDLDNFKAYNDVYGYRAGDAVIRLTAEILSQTVAQTVDFVGHVGGDDFVVVFVSKDWELRVQTILGRFEEAIQSHLSEEHLTARGILTKNRQGIEILHPLVSLSAGLLKVTQGEYASHAEISQRLVEAKKMAKQTTGSSYFIDRRQHAVLGQLKDGCRD